MAVRIIRAKPIAVGGAGRQSTEKKKLRVAAYCRVSTDMEEQESSYEAQCTHYGDFIRSNPEWELAGIFADEGISGTSTRKREEFNRMIRLCENHQIDMVITKSISRFARNTLDAKGAVLITISQNIRMGIQYRFQQGVPMINASRFLGYRKDDDGKLVIDEGEARIIRWIFRAYIEGFSPEYIAGRLRKNNVRSGSGKTTWPVSTVRYILQNEKYIGDLLLQKTLVSDFLTHKSVWNRGELPQYYVENSHEPIIPREVFRMAQGETLRRRVLSEQGVVVKYGRKYALSGRLFCKKCGGAYNRFQRAKAEWRCSNPDGLCDAGSVKETLVKQAVLNAINRLPVEKENIVRLQERARTKIEMIDGRLDEVERKIVAIETAVEAAERAARPNGELEQIITVDELNKTKEELLLERAEYASFDVQAMITLELIDGLEGRPYARRFFGDNTTLACYEVDDFFDRTRPEMKTGAIREFDEETVVRYIKDVLVCEDRFQINFKAGVTIEIPWKKRTSSK